MLSSLVLYFPIHILSSLVLSPVLSSVLFFPLLFFSFLFSHALSRLLLFLSCPLVSLPSSLHLHHKTKREAIIRRPHQPPQGLELLRELKQTSIGLECLLFVSATTLVASFISSCLIIPPFSFGLDAPCISSVFLYTVKVFQGSGYKVKRRLRWRRRRAIIVKQLR